jgi:hypothetical protein
MKLIGTKKKNKIAKKRSRKQKVISAGMGLKTFQKMMTKPTDLVKIASVVGEFTELRTIVGTFVIGYELEFDLLSFNIDRGFQRMLLKEDRIPFGFNKIFLSGDYIKKNKLGVHLNSLIQQGQHPYLRVQLMNPELIYLTVSPDNFELDIYKMYYIMFYKLLLGRILYYDDDIIAIDITHMDPHVIILIPNTRKQMRIEDQPDIEPIIDITKSKMQCTVDIPVEYYDRILDIFIILLLPDTDNTGQKDDIIESNEKLQLILWCKENCDGDQFGGLILYYYLCYLKYHYIREKDPRTSKYTKGSISFAFRHNPIEMLETIKDIRRDSSFVISEYRKRVTDHIVSQYMTDKIFTEDVPKFFINMGRHGIFTSRDNINSIFDNFVVELGITQVDIVKDRVSTFKLEFRSMSRDNSVVKISKIFDLSKFIFDNTRLTEGKEVIDVLTHDCLRQLIDPQSRILTNGRFTIPGVDTLVYKINKILDTRKSVLLQVDKMTSFKTVKSNKQKRATPLNSRRSNIPSASAAPSAYAAYASASYAEPSAFASYAAPSAPSASASYAASAPPAAYASATASAARSTNLSRREKKIQTLRHKIRRPIIRRSNRIGHSRF